MFCWQIFEPYVITDISTSLHEYIAHTADATSVWQRFLGKMFQDTQKLPETIRLQGNLFELLWW